MAKKSTGKKSTTKTSKFKLYTTTTCPLCVKAKEFFKMNNVKYTEVNVSENEQARNEMFDKSGQFGVPVIDVNGTIIVGYDKEALKKALDI